MKALTALIGLGLIASLAFNVYQFNKLSKLEDAQAAAVAEAEEVLKDEVAATAEELAASKNRVKTLADRVNALETEVAEKTAEAGKKNNNPMEAIGEMFENEDMRKMIRAQMQGQVDMMFGDLYDEFQLEGEDLEMFKELLIEQQMTVAQLGMRMMKAKGNKEEATALREQIVEYQDAYKEKIREFLNSEEDYEKYEFYTKTQAERMELDSLSQSANKAGHPLSAEQESALVTMMHEERKNFDFDHNFEEGDPEFEMNQLNSKNLERHFEQMAAMQEGILQKAGEILSPEQLPLFETNQGSFREMLKMQMNMASQMMGGAE
ncbi:MAG: hypothetical protein AAGJ79_00420 [Verrucomicrobiota bacterium]